MASEADVKTDEAWLLDEMKQLATTIHQRCYEHVPQWRVASDARGVLSQIDNMTAGLMDRLSNLEAAISWVEPPFVDAQTSHEELKRRVEYLIQGAERAVHGPRPA